MTLQNFLHKYELLQVISAKALSLRTPFHSPLCTHAQKFWFHVVASVELMPVSTPSSHESKRCGCFFCDGCV